MLLTRKRGNKHQKGGFRQMKICDQRVNRLKPVAGINEDIRPSAACFYPSVLRRCRLQRTAAGGSDTDDSSSLLLCLIDQLCLILLDKKEFRVHVMLCHILHLNGSEGSQSHMQRHMRNIHAFFLNLL